MQICRHSLPKTPPSEIKSGGVFITGSVIEKECHASTFLKAVFLPHSGIFLMINLAEEHLQLGILCFPSLVSPIVV